MNFKREYLKITAPNTTGSSKKQKLRALSKNPLAQFGLLAVALILILIMSETKIIPVSTSEAIGSVLIYAIAAIGFCLLLGYSGLAS